jgi:hypothetical protein
MGRKRPERTERRTRERAARQLVRDREKLAALSPGGSAAHPIEVGSSSVVEVRVGSLHCPQCDGAYRLVEHRSPSSGIREVSVICRLCHVPRTIWFRLVTIEPN